MSLQLQIDQDIKQAMLGRQEAQLRALRAVKSALLLAKTEKGAAETLTEEAEIKVLQRLIKQRKESADIYQSQGRNDLYMIEFEELQVIEKYLPQQMDRQAVEDAVRQIITELNATSIKDMGKVMGAANKNLSGRAEGKIIAEVVKQLLA
jgi:uncharacterized protein YqeY